MRIAICDDEEVFVRKIYQFLWQQHDCVVDCFLSPVELLEKIAAGERYDVFFLDILIAPINGMELARELKAPPAKTGEKEEEKEWTKHLRSDWRIYRAK